MRNSFKVQESNKYLVESWDKANSDSKKHVVNIEESSYKSNLTSGKISFLDSLKPQYESLKPATSTINTSSTPSPSTSSPSTNFASKNKLSSSTTSSSPSSTASTSPSASSPSNNTSSNNSNNNNASQSIGTFVPRNLNKPWGK